MSVADMLKAKAAKLRASKGQKSVSKPEPKKAAKATTKKGKAARVSTRARITDKKGHFVTGRDNTFVCVECGKDITGPWSYKNHLVHVHKYSRSKAGLRDSK